MPKTPCLCASCEARRTAALLRQAVYDVGALSLRLGEAKKRLRRERRRRKEQEAELKMLQQWAEDISRQQMVAREPEKIREN